MVSSQLSNEIFTSWNHSCPLNQESLPPENNVYGMYATVKIRHQVLLLWAFLSRTMLFFMAFVKAILFKRLYKAYQLTINTLCVLLSVIKMFTTNEESGQ